MVAAQNRCRASLGRPDGRVRPSPRDSRRYAGRLDLTDHLSKRAPLLAEILRYINDRGYGKAGEARSFAVGDGASQGQFDKDEVVFRRMRRLVYDHVARTVASNAHHCLAYLQ
jgi:hypothetical protein